jgi:TPR repeat protein
MILLRLVLLANSYHHGLSGFQQDHIKAIELFTKSVDLGYSKANSKLSSFIRRWKI